MSPPRAPRAGPPTAPASPPTSETAAPPSLRAVLALRPVLLGLVLVLVTRVVFWWIVPTPGEDAYITFRFARNLLAGGGAVFNPGERVMGYTSPLWMVWSAAGIALLRDPATWSRLTLLLADGVTLLALAALLEWTASRAAVWCFAVMFGLWPFFSAVSASGMESGAMLALLALGGWLVARRSSWAGPALGALALIRPEGVLCAGLLAVWANARARLIAGVLAAAGFAAIALYYGSPIPQSVLAKAAVYGTPGPLQSKAWWDWVLPFDLAGWPTLGDTAQLWTLRLLLGPGALAGLLALRRSRALPLVLAGLAVWTAYIVTGATYFFWYLTIPATLVVFLAAAGMPRIARGPWLYVAATLLILGAWTYQPRFYRGRAAVERGVFGPVATRLATHARAGESVFLEPLGIIGWTNASLVMHDEVGLVAPWVARRRTTGPGWYADALEHYRPDWVVMRGQFIVDQRQFSGRTAPFRDSTEFRRAMSVFRLDYPSMDALTAEGLVLLQRTR